MQQQIWGQLHLIVGVGLEGGGGGAFKQGRGGGGGVEMLKRRIDKGIAKLFLQVKSEKRIKMRDLRRVLVRWWVENGW